MKRTPNHQVYIEVLRRLTPEQRLLKAFELTAMTRELFMAGLRQRHPDLPEEDLRALYLQGLQRGWDRPE